jgi:sugar lactone lactonase YvrE
MLRPATSLPVRECIVPNIQAEVVLSEGYELGEGSLWDERQQRLYWVDIAQSKVFSLDPNTQTVTRYDLPDNVGTVVLSQNAKLLLGLRHGLAAFDPITRELTRIADPEADRPNNRFNDGKCDPQGRFWVGTMVEKGPPGGAALYCLDKDLSITTKLVGVTISNGLVWSGDSRCFFYIDTPTHQVRGYDFEPSRGTLSNPRVVAEIPKSAGAPDGMAIDQEDHLWVALWGGNKVLRLNPVSGETEYEIALPTRNVTSCAFGGEHLDELYITTARAGLKPADLAAEPLAGALFRARVPVPGARMHRFGREL